MSFTPPGEEQSGAPATPPPAPPVPGWWLASDGNWYPPQTAPPIQAPPPYGPPPAYGPPPNAPYGYSPYAPAQSTNGFAIASLVLGILWVYWIGSILAIIFGFIALSQIKERHQSGKGMATAGLILGFIGLGLLVLVILLVAASGNASIRFSSVSSFNN
ncbi:MAG: hypothetical protein QOC92_3627 [Acidimicrobiaceae bacterium]